MSKSFESQVQAFIDKAAELELWAYERLANREDRICRYHPTDKRDKGATYWLPYDGPGNAFLDPRTVGRNETDPEKQLADAKYVLNHFAAGACPKWKRGNIVALPTTSPESTCKWLCVDIDQHGEPTPEVAEKNLAGALEISARLAAKGIRCVVEDSNGAGGYHVWALFAQPVGARDLYEFGRELIRGLDVEKAEFFPKQGNLRPNEYGNVVRVPGVHHTRNHVSKFWNGAQWLEGPAAVDFLLAAPTNDPALIPVLPPAPPRVKKSRSNTPTDLVDLKGALEALPDEYTTDYDQWKLVMLALAREANNVSDDKAEQIYELAADFSSRWPDYDDDTFEDHQWPRFIKSTNVTRGDQSEITVASIFKWAIEAGWKRPPKRETYRIPLGRRVCLGGSYSSKDTEQTNSTSLTDTSSLSIGDHASDDPPPPPSVPEPSEDEGADEPPQDWSGPNDSPQPLHMYPWTDAGNAERLYDRWGDRILWCQGFRSWLIYDGQRWRRGDADVEQMALETMRAGLEPSVTDLLSDVSPGKGKPSERELWVAFCRKSENQTPLEKTVKALKRMVPVLASEFDQERLLLNCQNGVVNLQTGEIVQHHPSQRFLKITPFAYRPRLRCPRFLNFLSKIFENDQAMIDYMQTLCGYFSTGEVSARLLPIWHGGGSNGKGVLVQILQGVLGEDYVSACPSSLLVERPQNIDPDLANLQGIRLVYQDETEGADVLRIGLVKRLTGGSKIKGARKYENSIEFDLMAKILIMTNHKPRIPEQGHAIWTRICLVPFNVRYWDPRKNESGQPGYEVIENLDRKLIDAEGTAILSWIIEGAKRYKAEGLRQPERALEAKEKYKSEQDMFRIFLQDIGATGMPDMPEDEAAEREYFTTVKLLYDAYKEWGSGSHKRVGFEKMVREAGYQVLDQKKIPGTNKVVRSFIPGIRLMASFTTMV